MVNASEMLSNSFSIRFQSVKALRDPRTANLVVSQEEVKEFFNLVERFGLVATCTENDVWHVTPNPNTDPKELERHMSTWDLMLHKYMSASNEFRRQNEEYLRKSFSTPKVVEIQADVTGSMACLRPRLYCSLGKM